MKTLLSILTLFIVNSSLALVVEVNQLEKKVYYHPTPELSVHIMDLEGYGGSLSAYLNYDGPKTKNELAEVKKNFPQYQVQVLGAAPAKSLGRLEIADMGFSQDIYVRNGQLGPYINANFDLSKIQMEQLKKIKDLSGKVSFKADVQVNYTANLLIEEFRADPRYCEELKIQSVKDLIQKFSSIKKPSSMKYAQTFDTLKESMLDQCFDVVDTEVKNFKDLLKVEIKSSPGQKSLVGRFYERRSVDRVVELKPYIEVIKN